VKNAAGVLLLMLAIGASFAATQVRDNARLRPGLSTAADVPGTCHNDTLWMENELALAELTPGVSCYSVHTSEVLWTRQLTGILTKQHDRPTPEMLAGQYSRICNDPARLSRYIGQDSVGYPYNITTYPRYPSAPEWRAGLRTVRCMGSAWYHLGDSRATLDFPLRNAWKAAASATIRLCADASGGYLPCNQLHVQEVLEPLDPFPASQKKFPSPALSRRLGLAPCTEIALKFLGVSRLPTDLHVVVEPAEQQNWAHSHDVGCRIASPLRVGSLQAGLT